jgi:pyruvate carboxylase
MAASDEDSRKEVAKFEALAETAYNEMYDSRAPAGCYSDLKDFFAMAIGAAERLDHCKKVYRSQFAGF